jgi:Uma2 family endonuclease
VTRARPTIEVRNSLTTVASLRCREYLLVSQTEPRLELFRQTPTGTWELVEAGPGDRIPPQSIGVELAVEDVFANALAS